jgi:glycosyltransferase involved in cell wall biosynthesis
MIVYAVNIHTGGGKVLLDELIEGRPFGKISLLFVDKRYDCIRAEQLGIQVVRVEPRISSRQASQKSLHQLAEKNPQETILFFGNLPPSIKFSNRSVLYLQNCFLFNAIPAPKSPIKTFIRILLERLWLRLFIHNIDAIWVQTSWMAQLTQETFPGKVVSLKPFLPQLPAPDSQIEKIYDFISVTSLSPHKNFQTLIEALKLLDLKIKTRLRVALVLDSETPEQKIQFQNIDLLIINRLSREELFKLYQQSRVAVVTSSFESFCLPLHEALHFQTRLLCLNAPYIQDVRTQVPVYEENSPVSLYNALLSTLSV